MEYWDAIQTVLDEAESSALGDNNQEVLEATEMVRKWLESLMDTPLNEVTGEVLNFLLSAEEQ